jgi:hypothetical protein
MNFPVISAITFAQGYYKCPDIAENFLQILFHSPFIMVVLWTSTSQHHARKITAQSNCIYF